MSAGPAEAGGDAGSRSPGRATGTPAYAGLLQPAELPSEFVLLRRPGADGVLPADVDGRPVVELLAGPVRELAGLDDVPAPDDHDGSPVFLLVPYRTAAERGMRCREDDAALLAMRVHDHLRVTLQDPGPVDPATSRAVATGAFDVDDSAYEETVRRVTADEIGGGEGANFVISRSFLADIPDFSVAKALAVFHHLLRHERGAYWTFLVRTRGRTLVGATPERHVTLAGGVATMNPISGTYRYPEGGPTADGLVGFLGDGKESDELFMVLDEELKMMAAVCGTGVRVDGPRLRMMAHLAHTEYVISGPTALPPARILRGTMFAPTVVGSPLVNAFRVIARHERGGRGYYSGVAALISRDAHGGDRLDSAILIRTAEIRPDGRLRVGAGSTVVRHSRPAAEADETRAKVRGLLGAMGVGGPPAAHRPNAGGQPGTAAAPQDDPRVRQALLARNTRLNGFWLGPARADGSVDGPVAPHAGGVGEASQDEATVPGSPRVLVLDAEDTFTSMLAHHVRALGCPVGIRSVAEEFTLDGVDCVLLGPGPGSPLALDDPRIARLHAVVRTLLAGSVPFLAVCLSHQVLSSQLGLPIRRRREAHQGVQRRISLFGEPQRVGSYNSYVAECDRDVLTSPELGVSVEVSRDDRTGEVHALRSKRFSSVQFHLESVLTQNGRGIAATLLTDLCGQDR
ncbi:anthranilate synthase family protein [Actinacidiphila rubida]|uniref:anthranilate synthase n=1 Tax=Actinacidiphila rubida TaxID=310780 RepID=A0A1H8LLG9_9ACTN|nr:anthranilate synthase family protein [Actinacidiphila rubida]SEO06001.1 phenazine biosynthesis protein phzE [Actinacidiphila rubida]